MRTTSKVILKQLANEGISYHTILGMHVFYMQGTASEHMIACQPTIADATRQALRHGIRVVSLLAKLEDSFAEDSETPRRIDTESVRLSEGS